MQGSLQNEASVAALASLGQTINQEGPAWQRAWVAHRSHWPALVGWSNLLLQRLQTDIIPQNT
jgi:hypothetical protein